jgi:hypothetical protein
MKMNTKALIGVVAGLALAATAAVADITGAAPVFRSRSMPNGPRPIRAVRG